MRNLFLVIFIFAALATAGILFFKKQPVPEEARLSLPFEMLGKVLALQTLDAVPEKGSIYVLRYRSAISPDNPVLNPAAETFLQTIRKDSGPSIKGVEEETFDPFMLEAGWKNTTMESARFIEFVAKHADVDAIVIIGGTPQLDPADYGRLPTKRPKIITASIFTAPDRQLLKSGVIASAIVSHPQGSEIRTPPKTPQEWFDRRYAVWTGKDGEAAP